jgi:hypothetical protein
MNAGPHASNPDNVLNVEVEFRGEDAELIIAAREAMGPAGTTYAEALQRLALHGAKLLSDVTGTAYPHIIVLIMTCAMAPWIIAWYVGGA